MGIISIAYHHFYRLSFHFLSLPNTTIYLFGCLSNRTEEHWQSMLPNTPMPTALQKLLPPAATKNFNESAFSNATVLFLHKDLRHGRRMRPAFARSQYGARFIPRQNRFAIKPESIEANNIKTAIEDCKIPKLKGEDKYCTTSLESLVDFIDGKLGRNQKYAYAVFIRHTINPTKAYTVPLMGSDGGCLHIDTSAWTPKHYAFQVLKVKPGTTIYHFLNIDTLLWVPI
ncbi:hypothetical protein P3X46_023902 [Hevea brasiliensis]|uniref:BURP domain-containing protein n=1 Tax=Hevea brasiliensis TaxID=3981 RepID=A0ABQ9LCE8_HEVBR|nr:hypothetical protein P3X46_023902 [Hevea brasiliensis]